MKVERKEGRNGKENMRDDASKVEFSPMTQDRLVGWGLHGRKRQETKNNTNTT